MFRYPFPIILLTSFYIERIKSQIQGIMPHNRNTSAISAATSTAASTAGSVSSGESLIASPTRSTGALVRRPLLKISIVRIPNAFACRIFFMESSTMIHSWGCTLQAWKTCRNDPTSGLQCGNTSVTPNICWGVKYDASPIC